MTPAPPPSPAVNVVDDGTQPSHWKRVCPPRLSFPPNVGPNGQAVGHWCEQKTAEQLEHEVPSELAAIPVGHASHNELPWAVATVPGAHHSHAELPASADLPTGHSSQAEPFNDEALPAPHAWQRRLPV